MLASKQASIYIYIWWFEKQKPCPIVRDEHRVRYSASHELLETCPLKDPCPLASSQIWQSEAQKFPHPFSTEQNQIHQGMRNPGTCMRSSELIRDVYVCRQVIRHTNLCIALDTSVNTRTYRHIYRNACSSCLACIHSLSLQMVPLGICRRAYGRSR